MLRPLYLFLLLTFLTFDSPAQQIQLINSGKVIEKAKSLYDSGDYAQAIKEFYKVPERDTNYVLMLAEAALTHIAAEQYDEALALCEKRFNKTITFCSPFLSLSGCRRR